jgi:hypothetical protein
MHKKVYKIVGLIALSFLILMGFYINFNSPNQLLKGWSIVFISSGIAGLIGLFIKNKIWGLTFILLLLSITIYLIINQ